MIEKCQVFTPKEAVIKLLDVIDYNKKLYGKRIIENACGDGNVLVVIVERYILDCLAEGFTLNDIKIGMQNDIYGAEVDLKHYKNCINNLNLIASKYKIYNVNWKILNVDILKEKFEFKFDYVVGNPPYINYRELNDKTRRFLKQNYEVCKEGKFDYCYAFIESGLKLLKDNGSMSYLIPSSIFKNVFAKNLRNFLLPFLDQIHDYKTIKLFDALTSSSIIVCKKGDFKSHLKYIDLDKKIFFSIDKEKLLDKWIFSRNNKKENERMLKFGDFFHSSITVATLLNEAFVIKNTEDINEVEYNEKKYIKNNFFMLEKEILKDAVSPRSLINSKKELIIFPYFYHEGKLKKYSEEDFERKFPFASNYLKKFIGKLLNRNFDKNAKWFEYGRTQALAHLNQKKLLLSTVITKKINVYEVHSNTIPYSGIYIIKKSELGLDFAKNLLESDDFYAYINKIGINANGSSLRITAKDINNYMFNLEGV